MMWVIYFAGAAEGLSNLFGFVAVASFIALIFMLCAAIPMAVEFKLKSKNVVMALTCWTVWTISVSLAWVAIPDKTTIYLMASTKVAEDIIKSPEVKEINGKILTIINQKLDSVIEPTSKEK